jgi:predicted TIM-barrel fold metal-dependent hydrolase
MAVPASLEPVSFDDLCVIDADTHLTEPHDLWTRRAPAAFAERVPRVESVKGRPTWVVDGVVLGHAGGASAVRRDGAKSQGVEFFGWTIDDVHPGAHLLPERLRTMDDQGIWGQIVYPNAFGFGGQGFARMADRDVRLLTARLYNDAMAELQDESGGRLMPMAIMPWWDVDAMVAEATRARAIGLHGVNTTTAPHHHGLPDLGAAYWDPFWEVCADLSLPVNFHIGAAESDIDWYGTVSWPSLAPDFKLGIGSAMLYLNNAAVLGNLIYAGVLERHPALQVVSVESGVGWIPFFMHALDYQIGEMAPKSIDSLTMTPSDYFRRQVHSCFWFERQGLQQVIDVLGHEHVMFETDFPHPTCTYPNGLAFAAEALAGIGDRAIVRDLMGGNAARLYGVDPPTA